MARDETVRWRINVVRHLVMRGALGLVLGWFGIQQVRAPTEWVDFVPAVLSRYSPVQDSDLVLLHGFLLLLSASGILLGIVFTGASFLSAALMGEIIVSLFLVGGSASLIVRDVGLLGLAIGLALDPVRFWHLESALSHHLTAVRRRANLAGEALPAGRGSVWRVRAIRLAFIFAMVLLLALLRSL